MRRYQKARGFMIVELLIVIVIIGTLTSLAYVGITDSQAKGRDAERTSDIDTIHGRLEEYFTDNGGYPSTVTVELFPSLDPETLKDPDGNQIDIRAAVASQADATASPNPTNTGSNYAFIPYPTGCSGITCRGYVLKSFIEKPTDSIPNPYIRSGLHNN